MQGGDLTRFLTLMLLAVAARGQSALPPPMQVVSGAPYSADQIQERVETLSDETRVTHTLSTAKIYRDSQGRTRTERADAIEINDPVAAVRYMLDPKIKVAKSVHVPQSQIIEADAPTAVLIVSSGTDIQFGPPEPGTSIGAILTATGPGPTGVPKPEVTTEDLGTLKMEDILVEGRRQTIRISGKDGPTVSVSDTWTSPELKIVILSKVQDPRTGETSVKMTHLSRLEPSPDLFRPPPDYRIVDGPAIP